MHARTQRYACEGEGKLYFEFLNCLKKQGKKIVGERYPNSTFQHFIYVAQYIFCDIFGSFNLACG